MQKKGEVAGRGNCLVATDVCRLRQVIRSLRGLPIRYADSMDESISNANSREKLRGLYPDLREDQLEEADETLLRYLDLVLRICERLERDPEAYARFQALTTSAKRHTIDTRK